MTCPSKLFKIYCKHLNVSFTEKNDVSSDEEEETEDQAGGDEDPEEKDEKAEEMKSECSLHVRILHVRNQTKCMPQI